MPKTKTIFKMRLLFILLLTSYLTFINAQNDPFLGQSPDGRLGLTSEGAGFLAGLALQCIDQEYPNKLNQMLTDESMLKNPKSLHPAFYGCFDWHSAVHGHWMLVHLLRTFPEINSKEEIFHQLNFSLTKNKILDEVVYLQNESKSWERMYGWAWLMKLGEELYKWDDPNAQRWYANLLPLIDAIIEKYEEFLSIQEYPVRTGVHPNTAFGLSFAFDYALATGQEELEWHVRKAALNYFLDDEGCPAAWEPSGEDFLSPCLEEANLMRRVLDPRSFNKWFEGFINKKDLRSLLNPAEVSDRSDPKIVHLDGLNLSRASCFFGISSHLFNKADRDLLIDSANKHLRATLPSVASEHYEGSHWLGTFAVYALSVR